MLLLLAIGSTRYHHSYVGVRNSANAGGTASAKAVFVSIKNVFGLSKLIKQEIDNFHTLQLTNFRYVINSLARTHGKSQ